jgi:HK97 family phage major capsid protein
MTDRLQILRDKRLGLVKEGRDLIDVADKRPAEKRAFSAEEQEHIDRILGGTAPDGSRTLGEIEKVDEEIRKLELLEKQAEIADEARSRAGIAGALASDAGVETADTVLNGAFRKLADQRVKYVDVFAPADRRQGTMLGLGTPDHKYREARSAMVVETQSAGEKTERRSFDPDGVETRAAITKASTGAPVPTSFYDQLMWHAVQVGPMPRLATTIETTSGENMQFPRTSANSTFAIVAEAGSFTNIEPTFSAFITLGSFKYGGLIQLTTELVEDEGVDLLGFISEQAGVGLGVKLNTDFTVGAGTTLPFGLTVDSTLGVTTGTGVSGVPSSNDLIDLMFSVNPAYRSMPGCVFQARDTSLATFRKLKDVTSGQYLWQPGLNGPTQDQLLGFPIVSNPDVAATALNAKSVAFGVVPRYYIRAVKGIRFERSDEFAFGTGLVTFRISYRVDGRLIDQTGAVKHIVGAAS